MPVQLAPRIAPVKATCERTGMTCHISHQCQSTRHRQCAPSGTPVGHCETYPGAKWLHRVCVCVSVVCVLVCECVVCESVNVLCVCVRERERERNFEIE